MSEHPPSAIDARDILGRDLGYLLEDGPVCLVAKRPKEQSAPRRRTIFARKFTEVEKALEHVRQATEADEQLNFYVVRNPSGSDLYRKKQDGDPYAVGCGEMGNPPRIPHLTALRWIPIDIDPKTDDHEAARASALEALDNLGVPLWFVMDSGRGIQAQVRVETPAENTPEEAALFKACAKAIYARLDVDQDLCEVDRVQNPNRQSRLVGTINRKTGRVAHFVREDRQQVSSLAVLAELLGVNPGEVEAPGEGGQIGHEWIDEKLEALNWDPPPAARRLLKEVTTTQPDLSALTPAGREVVDNTPPHPGNESVDDSGVEVRLARTLLESGEELAGVLGVLAQPGRHCAEQDDAERAMARCVTSALHGSDQFRASAPIVSPIKPYKTAGTYLAREAPYLKHYNDDWLSYDGAAYQELEDATVRSSVYDFLDRARVRIKVEDKWSLEPLNPTTGKVNLVMDALRSRVHVPRDRYAPPCWLDIEGPPPKELIACRNGLLHLQTGQLLEATPRFFTRNALDFDYRSGAEEPVEWHRFLRQLWGEDHESIEMLREIFGYLLVPDTRLQKAFLLVGPPRSGKGTIGRVLTELVGQGNTCAPTLQSLADTFGLQPLIGKQLAMVSDLRLGPKTDRAAVAENLLRITGEDLVSAGRKYKREWTGRLATRFLIMTNEVPRFADSSGALANRFVPLVMTRSFLGKEDPGLGDRLVSELPAILNWAIEGWRALNERGYFKLPESSQEVIQDLTDAASPVGAFVREACEIDPNATIYKTALFEAWREWCEHNGYRPGTSATFGSQLLAAMRCDVRATKPRVEGERVPHYAGIRLLPTEEPPFA